MLDRKFTVHDIPRAPHLPPGHQYRIHIGTTSAWVAILRTVGGGVHPQILEAATVYPMFGRPQVRHVIRAANRAHQAAHRKGHLQ